MTTIRLCSDLHLEFRIPKNVTVARGTFQRVVHKMIPPDPRDSTSVLVLAGDITSYFHQARILLEILAPRFAHIVYVAGNHEFYGHDMNEWHPWIKALRESFPNVHIAGLGLAKTLILDDAYLIFTTGWTPYGTDTPNSWAASQLNIISPDVKYILGLDGIPLTSEKFAEFHKYALDSIKNELSFAATEFPDKARVVVTHHVPSWLLRGTKYPVETFSRIFCFEGDQIMAEPYHPDFWLFGHTHHTEDRQVNKTRCHCNPRGYPNEHETDHELRYDPLLFIDTNSKGPRENPDVPEEPGSGSAYVGDGENPSTT